LFEDDDDGEEVQEDRNSKAEYDEHNRRVDEDLERLRSLAVNAQAELDGKRLSATATAGDDPVLGVRSPFRPPAPGAKRYKNVWTSKAAYDEQNRRVDEDLERLRSLLEKAQAELDDRHEGAEGSPDG
jgi:hypothetical protein